MPKTSNALDLAIAKHQEPCAPTRMQPNGMAKPTTKSRAGSRKSSSFSKRSATRDAATIRSFSGPRSLSSIVLSAITILVQTMTGHTMVC